MTNGLLEPARFTAFDGHRRLASGPLAEVALATKRALADGAIGPVLTYDDRSGRVVDLDLRGSDAEVLARLSEPGGDGEPSTATPRGRGRPKLGVVAREVTLLPRHWEWLAMQQGGASVALRKLVEQAGRDGDGEARERRRRRSEAAYHFMSSMAGDLPGFEEASRALFAGDAARFARLVAAWPVDVREHARALAFADEPIG